MDLFLLRHANADTKAATDAERPLSDKGVVQSESVARFCKTHAIAPQLILTSPLMRAKQTAEIVAKHLGIELKTAPWLASGMQPEAATRELRSYADRASVMIVGHEPDFSGLAAILLGGLAQLHLRKGSLTHFVVAELSAGGATLEFSLPPKLM